MVNLEHKIRSVLVLQPRGGDYAALIDFFRKEDILGISVNDGGAWSAEFHMPVSGSGPVVVTAIWDSTDAYKGWRTHPVREKFGPEMGRLVEDGPELVVSSGVYEVVISASRD